MNESKPVIILQLPPLPGTDTPHPGFRIACVPAGTASWVTWYPFGDQGQCDMRHDRDNSIMVIAAAAIAHFWQLAYNQASKLIEDGCVAAIEWALFCAKQHDAWTSISIGSNKYDSCRIVAYAPTARLHILRKEAGL